ncbi:MAG: translocation/assembly module TamB, partial [Pseudomonadota bacterium]|nr:translocation/assembly module TamB [Pseudomonadota bacterium]
MAKVDSKAPQNRQMLSPKRRTWLAFWSLLRLIIVLPLWLFGLIALVAGVALSPWGTGQLFSQGEQRGFFTYEQQEGALLDSFRLQGFQMAVGGTQITLEDFELAWAEDCLLSGQLCLDTLRVEGADIRLAESSATEEPPQESNAPFSIYLPFPIELRDIALNNVQLTLADGTQVGWEAFATSITAEQQQVTIAPTTLEELSLYLPPSPGVLLTQKIDTSLNAAGIDGAIQLAQPAKPAADNEAIALSERERLTLPEIQLPINVELASLLVTDVTISGAAEYQVERLLVEARAEGSDITLSTLELATPDADATLSANVTLSGDYPLDAAVRAELWLPELFPALSGEQVSLNLSGSLADLTANLNATGPVNASLTAQVDALAPTLPFEAQLESDRLQWPLFDNSEIPEASSE